MRWSIDSADAYSVAKVRRAVVEELRAITGDGIDLFALETVLGELLSGQMERGHVALAVLIERGLGGPSVHIYTQGPRGSESEITQGELRAAILRGTRVPMSVESTAQGTHYVLRVPMNHEARAPRRLGQVVDRSR